MFGKGIEIIHHFVCGAQRIYRLDKTGKQKENPAEGLQKGQNPVSGIMKNKTIEQCHKQRNGGNDK